MKTIRKYPLDIFSGKVEMPKGAQILDIKVQREITCVWALVDTDNEIELVIFNIFGTGANLDGFNLGKHIKTFHSGECVWHVFKEQADETK